MIQPQTRPGWYGDPWDHAEFRWHDGYQWTQHTQGNNSRDRMIGLGVGLGALALCIVGAALALFTNVSLLTGTGTVWAGAVIAAVAGIVVLCFRQVTWGYKLGCVLLAVAAVASAVYDEAQLQHKRDQIEQILDGP